MKYLKPAIITILLILADQISKHFFYNQQIWTGLKFIDVAFNKGISRSLPIPMGIIILLSLAGIAVFFWLYKTQKIWRLWASFLVAWTIWNLIDRVLLWGVRDFINIWFFNFPIFNFADILLTVWIIGLIWQYFLLENEK